MRLKDKKLTFIKQKLSIGFTLIELLVVFAISGVIAVIVFASYPDFTSQIKFESVSLDVALAIREAQVYGVGAKETSVGSEKFGASYGVYFDEESYNNANSSFKLFFDDNDNNTYDLGEELETIVMNSSDGFVIKDVCISAPNGSVYEVTCGATQPDNFYVTIMFKRPILDAVIMSYSLSLGTLGPGNKIIITVERVKDGSIKTITATDIGQISVQ